MRIPHLAACAAVLLAALAARAATPADAPPAKLKTQTAKIALAYELPSRDRPPAVELVQLPPGKIIIRDANGKGREHEVKSIWMAQYETRWDEYDVFYLGLDLTTEQRQHPTFHDERRKTRTSIPYQPPDGGYDAANWQGWESPGHEGFPANCIHFRAAQRYCAWLSKHTGKKFRLPTEAEWEYACRAGGGPVKPEGNALDAVAWYADNAENKTHAVGKKQPNPWGLYDMLGNVGEYVIRDPKDDKGLLAGGSYKDEAKDVHSGAREPYSPAWQIRDPEDPKDTSWLNWSVHHVGFRVVMED